MKTGAWISQSSTKRCFLQSAQPPTATAKILLSPNSTPSSGKPLARLKRKTSQRWQQSSGVSGKVPEMQRASILNAILCGNGPTLHTEEVSGLVSTRRKEKLALFALLPAPDSYRHGVPNVRLPREGANDSTGRRGRTPRRTSGGLLTRHRFEDNSCSIAQYIRLPKK